MQRYCNLILLLLFTLIEGKVFFLCAENLITFNVYHTPPEFLIEGKDFIVTISIYEPQNISHAFLSYRNSMNENFKIMLLKRTGGKFTGTIPSEDITAPWIEYFISAIDIKNEPHTLFRDHKRPYRVSVYKEIPEEPERKTPEEKRVYIASGYEQNLRESSLDVMKIDGDIFKNLPYFSIAQALTNFGGMDIRTVKNGFSLAGIRGFAPRNNQIQIRIDGRKLTSTVSRTVFLSGLLSPSNDIQKIEILKGPGSYIYGADAKSGVIDITTFSKERGSNFVSEISAGNLNSVSAYLHADGKFDSFLSSLSASFIQSDYYSIPEVQALSGGAINLKTSFSPSYNIKFDLSGGYNKVRFPGFTTRGDYNFHSESAYAGMKINYNKFYLNTCWNGDNLFKIEPFDDQFTASPTFRTNTLPFLLRSDDFRLESTYSFYTGLGNRVLAGSEVGITAYESPDLLRRTFTEKNAGIFIFDEIKPFEKLLLSFSYRFDWNSVLDPGNSYLGSITISIDDNNTIRLSQREGYRKPDYIEYTNSIGNLTNEVLSTTQIDYSAIIKWITLTISAYYNKFRNFIEFIPEDDVFRNVSENAETFGGEVNLDWWITKKLSIFANYSLLRGIDKSEEDDPNHIHPDDTNPNHKINAGIIVNNLNSFSISLTVNYSSGYKEDTFLFGIKQDTLQGYTVSYVRPWTTINLRAGYSMFKNKIEVGLYGTNILFRKHLETSRIEYLKDNEIIYFRGEETGSHIIGYITGKF